MKIAVIAPTELPARRANTIQVMKMACATAQAGHTVRLVAPRPAAGFPDGEPTPEALAQHYGLAQPVNVEWQEAHPALRRYDYALHAVRWAQGWAEMVYTRLPQAAALAAQTGFPTVYEVHDLPHGALGPRLLRGFVNGSGARRLVVITRALAEDLHARCGIPALAPPFGMIAADGVDLERYAGLPEPPEARRLLIDRLSSGEKMPGGDRLSPERFTAGYTGHLYAGRGVELLLALAGALPEFNFIIAGGEPNDVARLKAQAAGLPNVLLTGFIPNAELPLIQSACEVLVAPYAERVAASSGGDIGRYLSPMKLFEYLACGRAILCSDLPVLREVLNADNALLLPPGEAQAWASALRELHIDPERRLRLAKRARLDALGHSWESRAARIFSSMAEKR